MLKIFFLLLLFGAIPKFFPIYLIVAISIIIIGATYINMTMEKENPRLPEYVLIRHPRRSAFGKLYKNAFDWPFVLVSWLFVLLLTIFIMPFAAAIVAFKTVFNLK